MLPLTRWQAFKQTSKVICRHFIIFCSCGLVLHLYVLLRSNCPIGLVVKNETFVTPHAKGQSFWPNCHIMANYAYHDLVFLMVYKLVIVHLENRCRLVSIVQLSKQHLVSSILPCATLKYNPHDHHQLLPLVASLHLSSFAT